MNEKGTELQSTLLSLEYYGCVCWVNSLATPVYGLFFGCPPTCLELWGVHCAACWPGHREPPGVDHYHEGSREDEGSGDSEGDGSGDCKGPCCCYPPTNLMIRCQRTCAPHLSWRCGWQHLGSRHIPSPLPASPEAPASWPVFCDKHIEEKWQCVLLVNPLIN